MNDLKIQHEQSSMRLGDLHGADYNPREMSDVEMKKLVRSIREFGLVQPIVVRKGDGLIVGGHQRVSATRRMLLEDGKTEAQVNDTRIPVIAVKDLDDQKAKVLNLALNKISGEWDYGKLSEVFTSFGSSEFLEVSGFSNIEIADVQSLLNAPIPEITTPDFDVDAEIAKSQRRVSFVFDTIEDLDFVNAVLVKHGMKAPKDAPAALLAALRRVP